MRGKVSSVRSKALLSGITPAYAGKRMAECFECLYKKDHPRLCGEKTLKDFYPATYRGSPPPMRGKVFLEACAS